MQLLGSLFTMLKRLLNLDKKIMCNCKKCNKNKFQLLGRREDCCKRINFGPPIGTLTVCGPGFCEGGGTAGVAGMLNTAQLLGTPESDLIATYMSDLADSRNNVIYWQRIYNETQTADAQQRLNYWTARVASLEYLLSKGPAYIRKKGSQSYNKGGDLVNDMILKFTKTLNKVLNNDNQFTPGTIIDDIQDTLTTNYAGIPLVAWLGIAGAGLFIVSQNKKKYRRAA